MQHLQTPSEIFNARAYLASALMNFGLISETISDRDALETSLQGLELLECPTQHDEAAAIAIAMRQGLEIPGKTIALVTIDRLLARRVAATLRRWEIQVDDSAGEPLKNTTPLSFLRLIANVLSETPPNPVTVFSMLKHPFFGGNLGISERQKWLSAHELLVRRQGAVALENTLAEINFPKIEMQESYTFEFLLKAHLDWAEHVATAPHLPGALRLWQGPEGEEVLSFIQQLQEAARFYPALNLPEYGEVFDELTTGQLMRPRYGSHPRLFIWGPVQAHILKADKMIIGGLNEGTWPKSPEPDPWLSRPMRQALGLPESEVDIGLNAHYFSHSLVADEVLLTRALKVEGTPTVPSRWLLRLEAVLKQHDLQENLQRPNHLLAWAHQLDKPQEMVFLPPPCPTPPLSVRPRRLSVTQVETLMRDPYGIYARHILKLFPLDPLRDNLDAAKLGSLIHKIFEVYRSQPQQNLATLLSVADDLMYKTFQDKTLQAFWQQRFHSLAVWFIEEEARRAADLRQSFLEVKGELLLHAPGGDFTLLAKADRIDHHQDGSFTIIDYKTGSLPLTSDIHYGFSPQLPLEATILIGGGFKDLPSQLDLSIRSLEFWSLKGGNKPGEVRKLSEAPEDVSAAALKGLYALVDYFDNPETAYRSQPRPHKAPAYSDYTHLSRLHEWSRRISKENIL